MTFYSILYDRPESEAAVDQQEEPAGFRDLNLDQVVTAMLAGREQYDLAPLLYAPLRDVEAVVYRLEAIGDLEEGELRNAVRAFAQSMQVVRRGRDYAFKLGGRYHRLRALRNSMGAYCEAVTSLADALAGIKVLSAAFLGFREILTHYAASRPFASMRSEGLRLDEELAAVMYSVQIRDLRVTVRPFEGGDDFSAEIESTFAKFKQGEVRSYLVDYSRVWGMNHVEARVLDLVARVYPELFARLDEYCGRNADYIDTGIARFDREVQFYLAFLDYVEPLKQAGLGFCHPQVSATSKEAAVVGGFDLALAAKLVRQGAPVVCNDFHLSGPERVIVVTGPNQGGKTTFARMFGQLHYLASLGYPIPGSEASLLLCDGVFTHFEREERLETLSGKLEDELIRLRDVLGQATGRSVLVMNEAFTSTTLHDAILLGTEMVKEILARDLLCVYVTFVDELASLSEGTVSMVAEVHPDDPARRTYKVVREPAHGLAYADALARKYGVSYDQLKMRVGS